MLFKDLVRRYTKESESDITVLDLSCLKITHITSDVNDFINLETLLLCDNRLKTLDFTRSLTLLWKLDVSNNHLSKLFFPYSVFGILKINKNNLGLGEIRKLRKVHFLQLELEENPYEVELSEKFNLNSESFNFYFFKNARIINEQFVEQKQREEIVCYYEKKRKEMIKKKITYYSNFEELFKPIKHSDFEKKIIKTIRTSTYRQNKKKMILKAFKMGNNSDRNRLSFSIQNYIKSYLSERFLFYSLNEDADKKIKQKNGMFYGSPFNMETIKQLSFKGKKDFLTLQLFLFHFEIDQTVHRYVMNEIFKKVKIFIQLRIEEQERIVNEIMELPKFTRIGLLLEAFPKKMKTTRDVLSMKNKKPVAQSFFLLINKNKEMVENLLPGYYKFLITLGHIKENKKESEDGEKLPAILTKTGKWKNSALFYTSCRTPKIMEKVFIRGKITQIINIIPSEGMYVLDIVNASGKNIAVEFNMIRWVPQNDCWVYIEDDIERKEKNRTKLLNFYNYQTEQTKMELFSKTDSPKNEFMLASKRIVKKKRGQKWEPIDKDVRFRIFNLEHQEFALDGVRKEHELYKKKKKKNLNDGNNTFLTSLMHVDQIPKEEEESVTINDFLQDFTKKRLNENSIYNRNSWKPVFKKSNFVIENPLRFSLPDVHRPKSIPENKKRGSHFDISTIERIRMKKMFIKKKNIETKKSFTSKIKTPPKPFFARRMMKNKERMRNKYYIPEYYKPVTKRNYNMYKSKVKIKNDFSNTF